MGAPDHEQGASVARHRLLEEADGSRAAELSPSGTLDIESAEDFRQMFKRLLDSRVTRFLVDLGGLNYVDSSGLGSLMQLHREAKDRGGAVFFYSPAPAVRDIFELTHLDRVVDLSQSREEALSKAKRT